MHRRLLSILLILAFLAALPRFANADEPAPPDPPEVLALVSIAADGARVRFGDTGLPLIARLPGLAGGYLTITPPDGLVSLDNAGLPYQVLDPAARGSSYYLVYPRPGQQAIPYTEYGLKVWEAGSVVLLRTTPDSAERLVGAGAETQAITRTPKPVLLPDRSAPKRVSILPDPAVQAMIDQVEGTAVYSYTGALSGEWPVVIRGQPYTITTRNTYSGEPVTKATQYVGDHLNGLGLDVEYHLWNPTWPPNVIGERPGSVDPAEIYLVTAHLDDMPSSGNAPGADDNASGSVAVLTAADILTQYNWGCTLRFVFFTGEEQGLLGSHAYALRSYNAGEDIQGVLNLDMIAWNTGGTLPTINLHADQSDVPESMVLAQLFADVVDAYDLNLIPEIVPNGTGASDHASFWTYGYNAILGIEDFSDFNPYYHSVNDDLDNLQDLPYYYEFVRAAVGTFAHMTGCLLPADQGTLTGTVTDAVTELPLPGAEVNAEDGLGSNYPVQTDGAGVYTQTLPIGVYTVTASAVGYQPAAVGGVSILTDTVTTLDFALEPIPCEPVTGTQFTWTPPVPLASWPVVFTATTAYSGNLAYAWDFGDGGGGAGITTTHTYTTPGAFAVGLTASSDCAEEVVTHTVQVDLPWIVYLPVARGGDPLVP